MNEITPYQFNGNSVRVIMIKGDPWWVASDVCRSLGLGNVSMALKALDDDEKGISKADTLGGKQEILIVSEPGLYALMVKSKKEQAKKFRRWVFHVVLPEIRKKGAYLPEKLTRLQIIEMARDSEMRAIALEKEKAILAPKAAVYDVVSSSTGLVCMRDCAKLINIAPHAFTAKLRQDKYIFEGRNQLVPYQKYIDRGYFDIKLVPARDGSKSTYRQTFVTPCGVNKFREIYNPDAPAPGPGAQHRIFA